MRTPHNHFWQELLHQLCAFALVGSSAALAQNTTDSTIGPIKIAEEHQVYSERLHEIRKYSIALPASYADSKASYPLIVILDGEYYTELGATATQFLSWYRAIPEALVVGVYNINRRADMTPPDIKLRDVKQNRGGQVLEFLEKELIPGLNVKYRLLPLRVVVGHSHSALLAVYAMSAKPDLFRWCLAVDAPVHLGQEITQHQLHKYLAEHPKAIGRLVTFEHNFGWLDSAWNALTKVAPPSFALNRVKWPQEKHETMYLPGLYEGLKWLFKDIMVRQDSLIDFAAMKQMYDNLSQAYGYTVPIPLATLTTSIEDQLMAGDAEAASAYVEEIKRSHGGELDTKNFERWIGVLSKNPLRETWRQIVNSPRATPDQIAPFIGTWESEGGVGPGEKSIVTFYVENGKAMVKHRAFDDVGRELTSWPGEIVVLRMIDTKTIQWGFMNGMRPRTMVIAMTATLDSGGDLVGKRSLEGVSFSPERTDNPGEPEPFRLTRKSQAP